ncbi:mRNA-decapping enzyme 2 [Trichostrongylus colubriformis]|uniref:m7GpppN-mRNA hydrolase n=1 Tax=Trichostrongylus colubriformis TaxID=6319 RepID=A0AAN8IUM5_TRICO
MDGAGAPPSKKKHGRRRVCDSISKSPAPAAQQSPATKLLAALSKAQGKSVPESSAPSRQSGNQKPKAESATKQKTESRKKAGAPQTHQNPPLPPNRGVENLGSVGARMSRNQLTVDEAGPSTSNSRRVRDNSYTQNHTTTESYSLWAVSPTKATPSAPKIPSEVLQDLSFRFLANIPDEEKSDKVRMCFQVELAHWFYIDFYCKQEERKGCAQMGMREFARQIFKHCDELAPYAAHVDQVIDEWRWYKSTVPTYGAILLDETLNHVLLVQGFYASKNSWGFPKGKAMWMLPLHEAFKVNEGEEPRNCAIREVFEETGFNFGDHRPRGGEKKLQKFLNETMVRLYIVPDVPTDFPFAPQTRNEIRKIQWFNVWDLPTDRNDQFHRLGILSNHNFYTVMPFVQDLQKYIVREQERRALAAADSQKARSKNVMLPTFGESHNKASHNVPSSDISAVMDALFSSSVFPSAPGAVPVYDSKRLMPEQPSVPSLNEPLPTVAPSISNLSSRIPPSYVNRDPMLDTKPSRFPSETIPTASHSSHFRPLDSPISKGVMNVLTGSTNNVPRVSSDKAAPTIAHPIAIPAQAAPPPFINRPVYVAPKEKQARISLSETSAFTAFKSPSMTSSTEMPSRGVDKNDLGLHKLLGSSSDGDDSVRVAHTVGEKTPTGFLDSLSPDTDLGSEFAYMTGIPGDANHTGVGYFLPYTRTDGFIVQLCDAWKDFKLDRAAIFAGLPGFETVH